MVNTELLKDVIKGMGIPITKVAAELGITRAGFYLKLKTGRFTVEEVNTLKKVLRLTESETKEIFSVS